MMGETVQRKIKFQIGTRTGIYYSDNPGTRDNNYFSGKIWASEVIGKLIKLSLELWDTRNTELHDATPEGQNRIQRLRAIQLVDTNT